MYNKEIGKIGINQGYQYFCDSKHPLADVNTRVYLHRHLASIKLGRWLVSDEHVHHMDGNKLNNSLDNLEILSRQEHAQKHAIERGFNVVTDILCASCSNLFRQNYTEQKYCSNKCRMGSGVKDTSITKEILDELIPLYSWVTLGKMFNYTDNGIKKRAISLGCDIAKLKKK